MQHRTLALLVLTASSLTAMAGTTLAQQPTDPPRYSVQIAERLTQMKSSMATAIQTAEGHSKGVAIAVRTSMHSSIFQHHPSVTQSQDGRTWGTTVPAGDRPTQNQNQNQNQNQDDPSHWNTDRQNEDQNRTDAQREADRKSQQNRTDAQREADRTNQHHLGNDPATQDANRGRYGEDTLYAIVTCVVDRARVRDVVIDMRDNTVVGMQTVGNAQRNGSSMGEDRQWNDTGSQQQASLTRASDLMNASVRNASGTSVGDIDDLAIDPDTNRVVYGVLRRGGFFGMGESRYAIATSELAMTEHREVRLDLDESDFQNHAGFDNANWPTKADAEWNTNWSSEPVNAPAPKRVVKASTIIGSDVKCSDGKSLGEITDLIVDPRTGRVVYAIIDSDRGDMAVPIATVRRVGDAYSVAMTSTELQSKPILDADREPNWNDARWNRRMHDSYGTQIQMPTNSSDRSGR